MHKRSPSIFANHLKLDQEVSTSFKHSSNSDQWYMMTIAPHSSFSILATDSCFSFPSSRYDPTYPISGILAFFAAVAPLLLSSIATHSPGCTPMTLQACR